jgi:hypothetical protein
MHPTSLAVTPAAFAPVAPASTLAGDTRFVRQRAALREVIGMSERTRFAAAALCLLALLPAVVAASHSTSVEHDGLFYYLATERDTYTMYEYVPIEFSVTNVSDQPIAVYHPCVGLGGIGLAIWDPVTPFHPESQIIWTCCGCFTESWIDTLGAGESYSRQKRWDMYHMGADQLIWRAGTHTLEGGIFMLTFPGYASLSDTLFLDFEVLDGAAGMPGDQAARWGGIKALYR